MHDMQRKINWFFIGVHILNGRKHRSKDEPAEGPLFLMFIACVIALCAYHSYSAVH